MSQIEEFSDDEDFLGYDPHQEWNVVIDEEISDSEEEEEDEEDPVPDDVAEPGVGGLNGLPHPYVGMEFDSDQLIEDYFNEYSKLVGFGWKYMQRETKRKDKTGPLDFIRIACVKRGKYISTSEDPKYSARSQKSECEWKVNLRRKINCPWAITKIRGEHSHECKPEDVRHMAAHRRISEEQSRELRLCALVGIPVCKAYALMARRAGGYSEVGFTEKDGRNRLNKIRRLEMSAGDYDAMRHYLDRMMRESPNSYCASDLDDEGRLRNIFWADGRSREAYKDFGDVISFDATYMKNRYRMPFCPFIGTNHQGQSILLGCALISGESIQNYVWVFEKWLECMGGVPPKAMVTDQSKAILKAMKIVFPGIRTRLCLFHIMQNAKRHLSKKLRDNWEKFHSRMKSVIHVTLTVQEFEDEWGELLDDYGLRQNKWLKKIFRIREQWASVYFRGDFWAGMSSTQRCEGMNYYFKFFMNLDTSLKEFGEQFNEALLKRVEAEASETFRMKDAPLVPRYEFPSEAIFCGIYSRVKVRAFQKELSGVTYCAFHRRGSKDGVQRYVIQDKSNRCRWRNPLGTFYHVARRPSTGTIKCQCKNFEFTGILCRHIVCVFFNENIEHVPEKYI